MIPVLLTRIKTKDGIPLDGIIVKSKRKSKNALILVHGLSSRFYSGQNTIRELSALAAKNNITFLKFNNRGHDVINRDGKGKWPYRGGAFEKFTDCIKDIRAVIRKARRLGCTKIVLAGHSTGSNKVLYYMYKTRDHSVKALLLTAAMSDMAVWNRQDPRKMRRALDFARKIAAKSPNRLLPQKYDISSAQRYISLYEAGHAEDVFPYHNPRASWKELKSVRAPVAVVIGSKDEFLDRPSKDHLAVFQKNAIRAKSFFGGIIQGADHGFYKKEKELANVIVGWIQNIKI